MKLKILKDPKNVFKHFTRKKFIKKSLCNKKHKNKNSESLLSKEKRRQVMQGPVSGKNRNQRAAKTRKIV